MTFRGGLVAGLLNIGEQGMSQVLPCLYIGSQKDAQDLGQINRFRISHVVSAHQGAAKQFKELTYHLLTVSDNPYQNLTKYISEVNDFIHSARLSGHNVLVHCVSGISRSAFFIISYLMSSSSLSMKSAINVLKETRAIAQPNDGFIRQLEQFESFLVVMETVRLRRKYGSQCCSEDRKLIQIKLDNFHCAVKNGTLCNGKCASRTDCPTNTCRSPSTPRSFNIFRSRRSSASSTAAMKRRSLTNPPNLRDRSDINRERRNEVKSWPPATCSSISPTHGEFENIEKKSENMKFWRKMVSSWGVFVGRKKSMEASEENKVTQTSPQSVIRGAQVEYPVEQTVVCSGCSMELDLSTQISSPLHRGINISSASICSLETKSESVCVKSRKGDEQNSKFSHFKKIFLQADSPETK